MNKKVIAVTGATGAQGGGLVRSIVEDRSGAFTARAITRKPNSDKARELARLGAEVIAADLDDESSLARAFSGAYGAFCVTNFWEHFSPEKELAQAKNLALAARQAGVKHVIWSTLEDTREKVPLSDARMPTLMQKYKVPHFDAKGEADAIFAELVPTTFVLTAFYWENFIYFGLGPRRVGDGLYDLVLPMGDAKLPAIAVEDIGHAAHAVFKSGTAEVGKRIGISGEQLTGTELAAAMSRALRREIRYRAVTAEAFRGFGFPGAEDIGNMFQYKHDFAAEYCAARDVAATRKLVPGMLTFAAWLERYGARIPLEA